MIAIGELLASMNDDEYAEYCDHILNLDSPRCLTQDEEEELKFEKEVLGL